MSFVTLETPLPWNGWGNPFQNPPKKLVDRSPLYFRLASSAAIIKNSFHCIFDVQEHKIQRTGVRPAGRYFIFSGSCCQSPTPPVPHTTPHLTNQPSRRRRRPRDDAAVRVRQAPTDSACVRRATLPRRGVTGKSVNTLESHRYQTPVIKKIPHSDSLILSRPVL